MEQSNGYQPICMLAHDLLNHLSVIVGHCDLLTEEQDEDSECRKHLLSIREAARSAAADLKKHQCRLDTLLRSGAIESQPVVRQT